MAIQAGDLDTVSLRAVSWLLKEFSELFQNERAWGGANKGNSSRRSRRVCTDTFFQLGEMQRKKVRFAPLPLPHELCDLSHKMSACSWVGRVTDARQCHKLRLGRSNPRSLDLHLLIRNFTEFISPPKKIVNCKSKPFSGNEYIAKLCPPPNSLPCQVKPNNQRDTSTHSHRKQLKATSILISLVLRTTAIINWKTMKTSADNGSRSTATTTTMGEKPCWYYIFIAISLTMCTPSVCDRLIFGNFFNLCEHIEIDICMVPVTFYAYMGVLSHAYMHGSYIFQQSCQAWLAWRKDNSNFTPLSWYAWYSTHTQAHIRAPFSWCGG